jgi:two-component system response regulator DevR
MAKIGTAENPVRVAVVDDDESTRLCFQDILQSTRNFKFAGSFSNATEALAGVPQLQPDLALLDIRLPDLNGIECARRLKSAMPGLKIVMVTGTHEANWIGASLKAGAAAYLVKPVMEDQLLATLKFAAAGKSQSSQSGINKEDPNGVPDITKARIENLPLNAREREVLKYLAQGLLYKEISDRLGISYAAVHKSQHNIFRKLQVSNRSEAIRIWLNCGGG